ncbi:MAG: nitroreductase family protein [Oscillospiraceae bacterium]|nr:nitroreductase family protein [Oscillospiraceae bacterium]
MTNHVLETIRARRSIRFYTDEPVPQEAIDTLLEVAQLAPTGLGKQAWHFTVVRDRALLDEITEANRQIMLNSGDPAEIEKASAPDFDNFRGAPMAIIVSGETAAAYHIADCANATTTMALAAESMGLSSCYLAGFRKALRTPDGAALLARLQLPEGYEPEFALSIGYKGKEPNPRHPRREGCVNYIG